MKTRIALLAAVALVVLLSVGTAGAKPTKINFTGSEISIGTFDDGTETYPGGNYHVRDAVELFAFTATDPRVDGVNKITVNWNFKWMPEPVFVSGRMWGTFVLTNGGGYWNGTWTGVRDMNGFSFFHMVGHGGGGYEGLILVMDGERLTPDPTQPENYVGTIIETGNYRP